ncbi:polysaccharide deacetylase family protein [Hydrogenoanaerobacterium sp.]|uniref:polysaccharide deacetylase family protein n=1 Tax=Hydrogenoanaerobacterium sp. TaxID=2953763 RepID=UPI00289B379F|nr:polysaccharide deacetylase family protein [Hydrogenoanaerobacterium sp.]
MNYWVVGKRGLIAVISALCICIIASFVVANHIGKAIFVDGGKRLLPIYSVETDEKVVALGFNCAWDDADVPQILQILKENDVKATFFMVGQWAEKYPESVKALYEAGHELGNHSYSHPDMTSQSREQIQQQIQKCDDAIEKITGVRPKLFRAPSGAYNNTVVETANALGHSVIQWDCERSHTKSNPQQNAVFKG